MANKKISQLPAASALTGAELIETVQGGVNKQTTTQDIADLGGAGGGHTIEDEGTPLTQRSKLNFVGASVTVTDDSGDDATVVTITSGGSGTVNSGTQYRVAHYATTGTAVSEAAAITAARALKSDANGVPTHFDTATEPSLTELAYVKGVTSAIQTQLNAKAVSTDFVGVQDLPIMAAAMWPRTTSGCAPLTKTEIATSLLNIQTLDFDQDTEEYAQVILTLPRKWNLGTATIIFFWTASAGSGDVIWGIQGVANSNDDPLTTAFGTAVEVTDTLTAVGDICTTSATSAMTFAGTPAAADLIALQIYRKAANGSDTLTADAKLVGIVLRITTNAGKDA